MTKHLNLKEYHWDAFNCCGCKGCIWVDHVYCSGIKYGMRCPSLHEYEFDTYSAPPTVIAGQTQYVGLMDINPIQDLVILATDDLSCGATFRCMTDCVSWHPTQTCAFLASNATWDYITGSDGVDDTSLAAAFFPGTSITNIGGVWAGHGPSAGAFQNSPWYRNPRPGRNTGVKSTFRENQNYQANAHINCT